jgi:hypothetical protein
MIEKDFNSRSEVINWIIDTQINRRNITDNQRSYLIGKRYKEEKKEHGNTREAINERVMGNSGISPDDKSTADKIAEQTKVSHQTVKNAEKFAEAVDQVAKTTGVSPQKIIAGDVKATQNSIHQQTSIFTWHFVLKIVINRHIDKIQVDPLLCRKVQVFTILELNKITIIRRIRKKKHEKKICIYMMHIHKGQHFELISCV